MARQWHALIFLLLRTLDRTYSFLVGYNQKSNFADRSVAMRSNYNSRPGGTKNKPNKKMKKKKRKLYDTPRFSVVGSKNMTSIQLKRRSDTFSGKAYMAKKGSDPPRVLVEYKSNRNPQINKFRLLDGVVQCPHYPNCPSCVISKHVGDISIIESAKRYFSSTGCRRRRRDVLTHNLEYSVESSDDGFLEVVVPSDLEGWRSQAKLVVGSPTSRRGREEDGCNFGLYQKGTHTIIPIHNCVAHHPSINKAVKVLKDATRKVRTVPYSEDSGDGDLRYVQFRVERSTGKICLTLVWNSENLIEAQPHLSRLVKELTKKEYDDHLWHSIWCHCNNGRGNAIFKHNPDYWYRLKGAEYIREPLPSIKNGEKSGWLYFTPQTFRQGNMEGFDILAKDVARAIPGGSQVCELYAGVGVLGLTMLQYHHDISSVDDRPLEWIRCSDENPFNLKCFVQAIKSLDPAITRMRSSSRPNSAETEAVQQQSLRPKHKASYSVASATQALKSGQALGANVLVVDPPRKGLDLEVLDELCKPFNSNQPYTEFSELLSVEESTINWTNDVELLVYVSCGFDALARDSERLLSSGGWILESSTGYVLFPGSNHVETLCIFTRSH